MWLFVSLWRNLSKIGQWRSRANNKDSVEQPYLALGSDADVASDRCVRLAKRLLDAEVGESILPEDGACVHVGGHEATLAAQRLLRRQTLHVGRGQQVLQVLVQVGQVRVYWHLFRTKKMYYTLVLFQEKIQA